MCVCTLEEKDFGSQFFIFKTKIFEINFKISKSKFLELIKTRIVSIFCNQNFDVYIKFLFYDTETCGYFFISLFPKLIEIKIPFFIKYFWTRSLQKIVSK